MSKMRRVNQIIHLALLIHAYGLHDVIWAIESFKKPIIHSL